MTLPKELHKIKDPPKRK